MTGHHRKKEEMKESFQAQFEKPIRQYIAENKIPAEQFQKIYERDFISKQYLTELEQGMPIPEVFMDLLANLAPVTGHMHARNIAHEMARFLMQQQNSHPINVEAFRIFIFSFDWAKQKKLSDDHSFNFAILASKVISSFYLNYKFSAEVFEYSKLQNAINKINSELQENKQFAPIVPAFMEFFTQNLLHPRQRLLSDIYEWASKRGFREDEKRQFANDVLSVLTKHITIGPSGTIVLDKGITFSVLQEELTKVAENKEQISPEGDRYRTFATPPFPNPANIAEDLTRHLRTLIQTPEGLRKRFGF